MFGNYLGIKRAAADKNGKGGNTKYSSASSKASPSTKCQKCLALGHYSFDCPNPREYAVRPTRTQILKNPKLRTKLTESVAPRTEEMPKEGTAAAILTANEKKRADKFRLLEPPSKRRSRSASMSSSGSSRSSSSSGSSRSGSSSGSGSRSGSGSDSRSGSGSESGSDSGSERSRRSDSRDRRRRRRSSTPPEKRRRTDRSASVEERDRKGKGKAVEN